MESEPSDRLTKHYNDKYAHVGEANAAPASLSGHPRNRFDVVAQAAACFAPKNGGGTYLEIGAGSASVALAVAPHFDRMVLTEISAPRIAFLESLFKDRPNVVVADQNIEADPLPVEPESVDVAAMVAVIEHLFDPQIALRALCSVLRPGGWLIVQTPNIAKYTRRIKLLAGRFPSTASRDEGLTMYDGSPTDLYDEGHLHYFTFRSLERLAIERCGFARARRFGEGGLLARTWPSLFGDVAVGLQKAP